jgi:hypothetical protein
MKVEITEAELKTRQYKGAVFICRSCKDNSNKIMMLRYDESKDTPRGVYYQFCSDCVKMLKDCIPCRLRK